jgi:hypothetical protein
MVMALHRQISISTDVYAAIWAARNVGEESEDAILRRLLRVKAAPTEHSVGDTTQMISGARASGFVDPRFGIELPENFEIFRTYQGVEYRAKAVGGSWLLLNDGRAYASLNQLSRAIGTKTENAWNNWYFINAQGKRSLVNALRRTAHLASSH